MRYQPLQSAQGWRERGKWDICPLAAVLSYQGYSGKGLTKIFQGNEHQGYSRKGLAKIFQGKEHQPKKRNQNIKIIVLTSPQDFSVVISRILKGLTYKDIPKSNNNRNVQSQSGTNTNLIIFVG